MSAFTLFIAALPLLATLGRATSLPAWEGCLSIDTPPSDATPIPAVSAVNCATQCWNHIDNSHYAYWDRSAEDQCLCSASGPNMKNFEMINADQAFGTCAEGIAVYARPVATFKAHNEKKREDKMDRLRKARATVESLCPEPLLACAVAGDSSSYECVDPNFDLNSCGGCINGAFSSSKRSSSAVDCSTLTGVTSNACVWGQCKAFRCESGYTLKSGSCVKN